MGPERNAPENRSTSKKNNPNLSCFNGAGAECSGKPWLGKEEF